MELTLSLFSLLGLLVQSNDKIQETRDDWILLVPAIGDNVMATLLIQ